MFAKDNLLPRDSVFSQVAYYASLAAVRMGDYANVLKYAPYAEDDATVGQYAMEAVEAFGVGELEKRWKHYCMDRDIKTRY